jgi:hypothetical protein
LKHDSKIGALSTFLQRLDKLGAEGNLLRFFRGHSKASYEPKPSIFRNPGWIENEATMLKELILRCPDDFTGGLTTFGCLVKMQHYGLPTRLLDVTSNPLAALYFACELHEEGNEDGEVIIFGYDVDAVKYFDSDTVSVIANLSRRPSDFAVPDLVDVDPSNLEEVIEKFNSQNGIKLLLHDIGNDKPHFSPKIIRADLERVVCVKPLLDNPRIIRQEGAFLLFGCDKTKDQPAKLKDTTIVARLTIKRDEKRNLLDQLDVLGISRATMFPEIEHVASHIKQSYFLPSIDLSKRSPTQAKVFGVLRDGNDRTVHDVARAADISANTASRAISDLRNMSAVELVGSGRDRRWKLVEKLEILDGTKANSGNARLGEHNA